jgi:peptide deformylase
MSHLSIIYAPNDIFKKRAEVVTEVNDEIRSIAGEMLRVMYLEKAIGIGANMVGLLKRIAVVDLQQNNQRSPLVLINPEIIFSSSEAQVFMEASISFPGIEAEIARPKVIKVKYTDYDGNEQELEAEGLLSSVIQHEMDYLDGKVFLNYLSKMKQDLLIKKMLKFLKLNPPHIHGAHCNH